MQAKKKKHKLDRNSNDQTKNPPKKVDYLPSFVDFNKDEARQLKNQLHQNKKEMEKDQVGIEEWLKTPIIIEDIEVGLEKLKILDQNLILNLKNQDIFSLFPSIF